jgi:CSLREA domain-containing protein
MVPLAKEGAMTPIRNWVAGCGLLVLASSPALAATIHVETLTDELTANSVCSLREALMNANANNQGRAECEMGAGADLILLPVGTVEMAIGGREENANLTGDFDVTESVTIRGQGAGLSTIDGNGIDRVLQVLASAASVTIEDLTITGGSAMLSNTEQFGGGGIAAQGAALIIRRCDLVLNTATSISTFLSVSGGGIFLSGSGTLTIEDSSLRDNTVTDGDTGIGVLGGGLAALNTASQVFLVRSTLSGNAAIHTGNSQAHGGGIYDSGSLDIENCTVSGNSASSVSGTASAGGIGYSDPGSGPGGIFKNLTLAGNSAPTGSGLEISGNLDLRNSIIAANGCAGTVVSLGGNVESPGATCGLGAGADDLENVSSGALALGALQYNGGYAETRALGAGSVAIDNGTAAPCLATDERGVARLAPCDSGAFEAVDIFRDGFESANFSAWTSHTP